MASSSENYGLCRISRVTSCAALLAIAMTLTAEARVAASLGTTMPGAKPMSGVGQGRPQGYLGIEFHDLTDDQVAQLHLRSHGVEILMVDHDGPAGKAGLQPHDIIVTMNGQLVASAEVLRRMIHDAGAGFGVALSVVRHGHTLLVNTQLADRTDVERQAWAKVAAPPLPETTADDVPASAGEWTTAASAAAVPAPQSAGVIGTLLHTAPFTGLEVEVMEPQLAGFFGAPPGTGLLIHSVTANSPAAAAGLRAGDILLRADTIALRSTAVWSRQLHASKGRPMVLNVLRDKHEMTVTMRPDLKRRSAIKFPISWELSTPWEYGVLFA